MVQLSHLYMATGKTIVLRKLYIILNYIQYVIYYIIDVFESRASQMGGKEPTCQVQET